MPLADFEKIQSLLKVPTHCLIAAFIVLLAVSVWPDWVFARAGRPEHWQQADFYVRAALLAVSALLLARGLGWAGKIYAVRKYAGRRKKYLQSLSVGEKEILRGYLEGQANALEADMAFPAVAQLMDAGILFDVSGIGFGTRVTAGIHPGARDYLKEHPGLLG
jgi:hypothetical protein